MIQDIPKLYTALAEWLACVLFVRLLPQRYNAAKTAGILAAALPLFGLVQWLIGIVPLSLWIPGMIVALVLMYATIWLCCRLNFCDTGFWWALAFTLAEFVASLEWQLYSFGASKMPGSWWIQGLFLLAFYGGGFGVFLRLEQKRLRDKAPLHMTRRESISAAVIAICTFLISNISYVTTNTPFSGRMTTEIFWIRTLVDFAGVAVLLSMQDRWQDMQTQHELTAIQTLLKRQYEQYRISRDNSEAINRKYHDLKHQIQVIRMESDAARREEYLSQLEKGMQSLGVNQHAACSGFIYAIAAAHGLLNTLGGRYALVIGCEALSRMVDPTDRTTCVLFGDGAGAAILELAEDVPFAVTLGARGSEAIRVGGPAACDTAPITMDGKAVFRFAVETMPRCLQTVLEHSQKTLADLDWVVCHQANSRIIDHCIKHLHAEPSKFYKNMDRHGNTSAASIPIALHEMVENDLLHPGQTLACIGFGGGLTWGGMLLTYEGRK